MGEHMMVDFKAQQDDLFAKDLKEKTRAQKLKDRLAKEEAEFEALELRRKKRKVRELAKENERKKLELEQKKEAMEARKMGKTPKKVSKSVSFPGSYDKIVEGKESFVFAGVHKRVPSGELLRRGEGKCDRDVPVVPRLLVGKGHPEGVQGRHEVGEFRAAPWEDGQI